MDAAQNPPSPSAPPPEPSSLTDRLMNVVLAPGEVFDEIKTAPVQTLNWLVPLLVASVATIFYICTAFSRPTIVQPIQAKAEASLQKKVAAGQMTQAQADQAETAMARFMTPAFLSVSGSVGAVLTETAGLFLMALLVWLGLKCCTQTQPDYMKVVEICGLALVIDVLQKIIRVWLMLWKENWLATASPALFLANPDQANKFHQFLAMFDVVDIWWLAVITLGVSKVASVRYRTVAFITFGIWFGFRIVAILLAAAATAAQS